MNEMQNLLIRAQKYLDSAELLLNAGDYESCVSRSYYAMFFMVQAALLHKEISASTHKGAISSFGEQFVKCGIFPRTISRSISAAFEKRQLGDYESMLVIEPDEAELVLDDAKSVVETIANWLKQNGALPEA